MLPWLELLQFKTNCQHLNMQEVDQRKSFFGGKLFICQSHHGHQSGVIPDQFVSEVTCVSVLTPCFSFVSVFGCSEDSQSHRVPPGPSQAGPGQ